MCLYWFSLSPWRVTIKSRCSFSLYDLIIMEHSEETSDLLQKTMTSLLFAVFLFLTVTWRKSSKTSGLAWENRQMKNDTINYVTKCSCWSSVTYGSDIEYIFVSYWCLASLIFFLHKNRLIQALRGCHSCHWWWVIATLSLCVVLGNGTLSFNCAN